MLNCLTRITSWVPTSYMLHRQKYKLSKTLIALLQIYTKFQANIKNSIELMNNITNNHNVNYFKVNTVRRDYFGHFFRVIYKGFFIHLAKGTDSGHE